MSSCSSKRSSNPWDYVVLASNIKKHMTEIDTKVKIILHQTAIILPVLIFLAVFIIFSALILSISYIRRRGQKLGLKPMTIVMWEVLVLFIGILAPILFYLVTRRAKPKEREGNQ
jgi:hypothetical protein